MRHCFVKPSIERRREVAHPLPNKEAEAIACRFIAQV